MPDSQVQQLGLDSDCIMQCLIEIVKVCKDMHCIAWHLA